MQLIMDLFSSACDAFGLTISLRKTKVMFTPPPNTQYTEPNIYVKGTRLEVVDSFIYLGSSLSRDGTLDSEVLLRIEKATKSFGALENRVWSDRNITLKTKIVVYMACVLTALLYSSETWTTYRKHIKLLERAHQKFLRRVLNIRWDTFTPDTEVLSHAKVDSVESMIMRNQMRWAGHLIRMDDSRLPKRLFFGELKHGKRPSHKPKKRFKDVIKSNLKVMGLDSNDWQLSANDRLYWRKSIYDGCRRFESNRIKSCNIKRALRLNDLNSLPANLNRELSCDICGKLTLSKAGLASHKRSHQNRSPFRHSTTCIHCGKVCKSSGGLKRHMKVHV